MLTPSGETSRTAIPAIRPYAEQRISLNWTVPNGEAIGNKTLSFTVDPDQMVTQDANRSNNAASVNIFIGRMPIGEGVVDSGKFTFENVTLNATSSYDEDGGEVECIFEVESRPGLIDVLEAPDCQTHWNWSDDGEWEVKITVTDDELDSVVFYRNVTVLNRAPYLNLTAPLSVEVESSITINASDSGDIDTISPSNQDVTISWPDSVCQEHLHLASL